jgi:hypothetical protein
MPPLTVNSLKFQPWTRWSGRSSVANIEWPGVYLLARFRSLPPPEVDPLDANIVYVGETVSQTLSSRWWQFNRSAFEWKNGHSGGHTFNRVCGGRGRNLYVAALPVQAAAPLSSAYIRFVERLLIWEFCRTNGDMPRCNRK